MRELDVETGVVFVSGDEPLGSRLDEAGIPYFVGEFEESMTSFDSMEIQLETFVENILFS